MKVKQPETPAPPIEKQVLAEAIIQISSALTALRNSGLNEKAIVLLVADSSGCTRTTVKYVIDGLANLKRNYCR